MKGNGVDMIESLSATDTQLFRCPDVRRADGELFTSYPSVISIARGGLVFCRIDTEAGR